MNLTLAASFTGATAGAALPLKSGDFFSYSVSGTFVGTVVLERSNNAGQSWQQVASASAAASGYLVVDSTDGQSFNYRFRCSAFTSGTIVTSIVGDQKVLQEVRDRNGALLFRVKEDSVDALVRTSQSRLLTVGAKVGTTAGWVVGAANNIGRMATCPASQTASTLVVPVQGLKVGDTITGFAAIGQVESAGATATLDVELRKLTSAAGDLVDATVGAITQLSVTADAIVSSANAGKSSLTEVVGADESFYFLITATTAAATDFDLQGISITVTEA